MAALSGRLSRSAPDSVLAANNAAGQDAEHFVKRYGMEALIPNEQAPSTSQDNGAASSTRGAPTAPTEHLSRVETSIAGSDLPLSIRRWPRGERPRERLLDHGAAALTDAELLAVLMGTGTAGNSALDIARELLERFGSLRQLLRAEGEAWRAQRGFGPARYAMLQASLELARRHYGEALRVGPTLDAPAATRQFLIAQLRDRPYEVFCCLHLDNRHRLIRFEEIFRGTIDGASVHPREIVRQAMRYNAAAVILAHNHPSGVAEASHADELITLRLREALALVDIRVLDHLIVGDATCLSFAERGLL
jgi:DNA repair protein RadC